MNVIRSITSKTSDSDSEWCLGRTVLVNVSFSIWQLAHEMPLDADSHCACLGVKCRDCHHKVY